MTASQQKNSADQARSGEFKTVEKIAVSFTAAFKYFSLYPEGHAFSRNYLEKFKTELDEFLERHGRLRLDIEKNSYFYKGTVVFQGTAEENNPAYLLSRDRILFLEFVRNIEMSEISLLLDVFKRHRNPTDNQDGDIATTLWHYRFGHIHYEAADIFAMEAIEFNLAMFKAAPGPGGGNGGDGGAGSIGPAGESGPGGPDGGPREQVQVDAPAGGNAHFSQMRSAGAEAPSSLQMLALNRDLSELDQDEQQLLDLMIQQQENKDVTPDAVDILLITLAVEQNELDFTAILDFLEFEFFDSMTRENFALAFKICKNVINISEAVKAGKPWVEALVNIFLSSLAREERYGEMAWCNDYGRIAAAPDRNVQLLNTLDLLPPEIVLTLGTIITQVPADNIHLLHRVINIIAAKSNNNPGPLCQLVEKSDEQAALLLLTVTEQMEDNRAARVFLKMIRHPAASIRKAGMDGLFKTSTSIKPDEILHLLQDPDKSVRNRILSYVEQLEAHVREELLISFLHQGGRQIDDELFILNCYRLLGNSLSPAGRNFLKTTLMESDLKSMFSHISKAHKTGAAFALRSIGTKDAMKILRRGAESMRPDIRQVCKKALGL